MRRQKAMSCSIRASGKPPERLEWDGTAKMGMMLRRSLFYALTITDGRPPRDHAPQIINLHYGTPLDAIEVQSAFGNNAADLAPPLAA